MARWSWREREGHDTPSVEEWFWYHVLPGGLYRTLTSDNPEDLEYYMISGGVWFGGAAVAADAAAAGSFAGEVSLARIITALRFWGPVGALTLAMVVVREEVGEKNSYQSDYDRIDRARTNAMGGTGTHVIGDFLHEPYYQSPSGDHVWYSFHPEWI